MPPARAHCLLFPAVFPPAATASAVCRPRCRCCPPPLQPPPVNRISSTRPMLLQPQPTAAAASVTIFGLCYCDRHPRLVATATAAATTATLERCCYCCKRCPRPPLLLLSYPGLPQLLLRWLPGPCLRRRRVIVSGAVRGTRTGNRRHAAPTRSSISMETQL